MSDKVVRWGFAAEIDQLGGYVTYHDYMMIKEDNDRLRAELANLQARDIHTCWAECPRPMCVMRRERDRAVAELAEANRRLADVVHAYEGQAAELAEAKAQRVPDDVASDMAESIRLCREEQCFSCDCGISLYARNRMTRALDAYDAMLAAAKKQGDA